MQPTHRTYAPQRKTRFLVALTAVLAVGCATSPIAHFYTLTPLTEAQRGSASGTERRHVVALGRITVAEYLRRPQLVTRVGDSRIEVSEFERWASPLEDQIGEVLAANLAVLLPDTVLVSERQRSFQPDRRLTLTLERFEYHSAGQVRLEASWVVSGPIGGAEHQVGQTRLSVAVPATDIDSIVTAHSRALEQLSREIAGYLGRVER